MWRVSWKTHHKSLLKNKTNHSTSIQIFLEEWFILVFHSKVWRVFWETHHNQLLKVGYRLWLVFGGWLEPTPSLKMWRELQESHDYLARLVGWRQPTPKWYVWRVLCLDSQDSPSWTRLYVALQSPLENPSSFSPSTTPTSSKCQRGRCSDLRQVVQLSAGAS